MKNTIFIALLFCFKIAASQKNNYNMFINASADKIEQKVVELPYSSHYPVTFNNESLTMAMLPSLKKSAGPDNVVLKPAKTGSEDFSFYAQKVPGLFFFLGALPKGKDPKTTAPHHTPDFMIDESLFKTGVIAFCNLVFDYPELNKK